MQDLVLVYEHPLLDQLCTVYCLLSSSLLHYYIITLYHDCPCSQLSAAAWYLCLQSAWETAECDRADNIYTLLTSTQYLQTIYALSTKIYINM